MRMLTHNTTDGRMTAHALDRTLDGSHGTMPTQGFRPASRSVRDCRLSANAPMNARGVNASGGVTGGYVNGAVGDPNVNWGRDLTMRRTPGSRRDVAAARKAARKARNAR